MHCVMVDTAGDTVVKDNSGRGFNRDHETDSGNSNLTRKNTVHVQFEGEQVCVCKFTRKNRLLVEQDTRNILSVCVR